MLSFSFFVFFFYYLQTPKTEEEWQTIAASFQQRWQFPHCLGALDGKHIFIQPPAHSGSTFHNYKGRFSILMMAVVDANYKFLYVSVGAQGRIADAGLFAHSDFRQALDQGLLNIPPPQPLPNSEAVIPFTFLGDDAYPLRADLMKPYSHRHMDHQERIFNYRLSRARRVVENAFGILANRWRLFRTTIPLHPDNVGKITLAAVCLHNFLSERHSDAYTPPGLADREYEDHRLMEGEWRKEEPALQSWHGGKARNFSLQVRQQRDALKEYFVSPAGLVPWQETFV